MWTTINLLLLLCISCENCLVTNSNLLKIKNEEELYELEFISIPEVFSELEMNEIRGGRKVTDYMGCGEHHDGTEATERLLALV